MGALFTQPYRGRCSLSPMGALSPIGGALRSVLLGALPHYGGAQPYKGAEALWGRCGAMVPLSPIGGAVRSVLLGALRRYGAFSPIGGAVRSVLLGALRRYGGAAALWGTQSYRGRRSLSPIGALRRYGGAVRSAL